MDAILHDAYVNAIRTPRESDRGVPYNAVDAQGRPMTRSVWKQMSKPKFADDERLCFFGLDTHTQTDWNRILKQSDWSTVDTGSERMTLMRYLKLVEGGRPDVWTADLDLVSKGPTDMDKTKLVELESETTKTLDALSDAGKKLGWDTTDANALVSVGSRTASTLELVVKHNNAKRAWYVEARRQKEMEVEEENRKQRNVRIMRVRRVEERIRHIVEHRVRYMDCAPPPTALEIQLELDAKKNDAIRSAMKTAQRAGTDAAKIAKEAAQKREEEKASEELKRVEAEQKAAEAERKAAEELKRVEAEQKDEEAERTRLEAEQRAADQKMADEKVAEEKRVKAAKKKEDRLKAEQAKIKAVETAAIKEGDSSTSGRTNPTPVVPKADEVASPNEASQSVQPSVHVKDKKKKRHGLSDDPTHFFEGTTVESSEDETSPPKKSRTNSVSEDEEEQMVMLGM